ncbi:ribosome maturation factor RimM [Prochlorococcus marinus]|uniref:ribosome maturation factor RimM n=1 Tax=Prochlorococcus marinus TaxID=1219 RepID=UPI0022B2EE1E|nr:ribosome maturation factor RimM [Prochlorococcus marinus]
MCEKNLWLTVGEVVAPQGLHGQVRINPRSDFPERFIEQGERWLQKGKEKPYKIQLVSGKRIPGKSIYIVSFSGIDDRNKAKDLVGHKFLVKSNQRPKLAQGEFHFLDLIGLKVKLSNKENEIGEVINLSSAGNDLLEVKLLEGKKVLIPFVKEIVPEIHIKEGWLIISPPKGLLDL